jgi:drug/metabolite transporter (DMT)-like permease
MKMGLAHISPLWFAACRFGSAALISFLVLGALRRLRLPSRQEWPLVIGVGLLQMGAFTAWRCGRCSTCRRAAHR